MDIANMIEQRIALVNAASMLETTAFPGSKKRTAYDKALMALQDFDDAHPEALEAIRAASRTRMTDDQILGY